MVRECSPSAREPTSSLLVRLSTMATSTLAKANSPANINPVGPPPAITTECSAGLTGDPNEDDILISATPVSVDLATVCGSTPREGPCRKPHGALYVHSGRGTLSSDLRPPWHFPHGAPVNATCLTPIGARPAAGIRGFRGFPTDRPRLRELIKHLPRLLHLR